MKKDKNLDELFRDKLLNFEQEPPAHILDNILSGMAGVRRKRRIAYWRYAGVAAALLLAFVAGWQVNVLKNEKIVSPSVVGQINISEGKTKMNATGEAKSGTVLNQNIKSQITSSLSENRLPKNQVAAFGIKNEKLKKKENSEEKVASAIAMNENQNTEKTQETKVAVQNVVVDNQKTSPESKSLNEISQNIQTDQANALEQKTQAAKLSQDDRSVGESPAEKTENKEEVASSDQQIMQQNQQMLSKKNENQKKGRWSVGAQISPSVNVNRSSHSQQYASNMVKSESANGVDLGGGINVEYKSGKRWSIQSGVYYSGLGQTSGNSSSLNSDRYAAISNGAQYVYNVTVDAKSNNIMMNGTAGVIELNGVPAGINLDTNLEGKSMTSAVVVSDLKFVQNFEYIEIPLYLRYTLLDSRFDVEMMGGFSSNLLVGNETFMESSKGKSLIGKTNDMVPVNYSGTLGIGLKYGLSKRIFLNVEPRVKYYLNSLNSNSSVTYKPYTIGVFTGLSYQF